jgi:AraC-like DNA-binding protein
MFEDAAAPAEEICLDTEAMPAGTPLESKIEAWLRVAAGACPLEISVSKDRPYRARARARAVTGMFMAEFAASGGEVRRTKRTIGQQCVERVYVFQQTHAKGSSFTTWNGRRGGALGAGDLFIGMADEPFESLQDEVFGHRLWMAPASLVLPFAPDASEIEAGTWLRAADPATAMLAATLDEFSRQAPRMAVEKAQAFSANAARLIAIASAPATEALRTAEADAFTRLSRLRREIEHRLSDPLLTPTRLSESLGIPLRTLHATFAPSGESCAGYITRRRLEEAKALLLRAPSRSVSGIAFGLGFNSMGTFFRTYQSRFGETPTQSRQRLSAG